MDETGLDRLRTVADYQFGAGAGAALFPEGETPEIRRSTSGRPQQVLADAGRIVSYGVDGRFTLGIEGGHRLASAFEAPRCRVTLGAESVPFVADGRNAFAKFVRRVDPDVRSGDEVLVVFDPDASDPANLTDGEEGSDGNTATGTRTIDPGGLLAVGRAELSAEGMADFETGMAVKVRAEISTPI